MGLLGNIFIYTIMLSPVFFYFKRNEETKIILVLKKILSSPLCLIAVIAIFIIEIALLDPALYELYAMTWHGFFLGLIAFFLGFCFVMSGSAFWTMLLRWKWALLIIAFLFYSNRLLATQMKVHHFLLATESVFWIFSVFAFGHQYFNKNSKVMRYLSRAAYPVYIIHMMFLYLASLLVFPLEINAWLKFLVVLIATLAGSFMCYELLIRRIKIVGPLFGMK